MKFYRNFGRQNIVLQNLTHNTYRKQNLQNDFNQQKRAILMGVLQLVWKNAELKNQRVTFMDEYESLGHMGGIMPAEGEEASPYFYLPH